MSDLIKVSDAIAGFLKDKQIKHVFGIIGSANSHIFDSISNLGYTEIVCVHHEQAATMAMQSYYRISGKITAAILTAGGGSVNGITGVLSAWADSIPGIIISGQETIGSAERSSDANEMREQFHTISEGMNADLLFGQFGKDRVEKELEEFLSYDMVPRVGGGIGITRLLHAMNDYSVRQIVANM